VSALQTEPENDFEMGFEPVTESEFDPETAVCIDKGSLVLRHLLKDPYYAKKFLPHLKPEYFQKLYGTYQAGMMTGDKPFRAFVDFFGKFNRCPSIEELVTEVNARFGFNRTEDTQFIQLLKDVGGAALDRLYVEQVFVEFIRYEHRHQNIVALIHAAEKGNPDLTEYTNGINNPPMFLDEAKVPGLDTESAAFVDQLFESIQVNDVIIPFDIDFLNQHVEGVRKGTFNVILAGTGGGKTLTMCHFAAAYRRQGLKVLYLTMEMKQSLIQQRIHANLLDVPMKYLRNISKAEFRERTPAKLGRLISNEYPTGGGHTGHFRRYLAQLKAKSNFVPDIIFVDYLNICCSEKTHASHTQKYDIVGGIAEELRALAQETDAVIWSATQSNRAGLKGQPDMTNISQSIQIASTADIILTLWTDPKVADRYSLGIAKHRNGSGQDKQTVIEVNYDKMKLSNLTEEEAEHRMKDSLKAMASKKSRKQTEVRHDIDK
jgi:hypothetical protein